MSELQTKINTAIERLKAFEPADEPYYLCVTAAVKTATAFVFSLTLQE